MTVVLVVSQHLTSLLREALFSLTIWFPIIAFDSSVDSTVWFNLLSQCRYTGICKNGSVKGVLSFPRRGGGVSTSELYKPGGSLGSVPRQIIASPLTNDRNIPRSLTESPRMVLYLTSLEDLDLGGT